MVDTLKSLELRHDGISADLDRGENIFAGGTAGGGLNRARVLVSESNFDAGN
jgi:hypothetical protein